MKIKKLKYVEVPVFLTGLVLLALMDPTSEGTTLCLLEHLGLYCPGEGLGHSIAHIFRGEFKSAMEANFMGPFAVLILSFRIIYLTIEYFKEQNEHLEEING